MFEKPVAIEIYTIALEKFLLDGKEASLDKASEIAETLRESQIKLSELFAIHQEALEDLLFRTSSHAFMTRQVHLAASFLGKVIEVFECGRPEDRALGSDQGLAERVRDLTLRLENAQGQYRSLVEQLPAISFILEIREAVEFTFISPQVESYLGFLPEQLISDFKTFRHLIHPDDYRRVVEAFESSIPFGMPFDADFRLLTRKGRALWFHGQALPVRERRNPTMHVHGLLFDITERKRKENELESVAQISSAIRTASNRQELITSILATMLRVLAIDAAAVVVRDGASFQVEEALGTWESCKGSWIPEDNMISRQVTETGIPYLNNMFDSEVCRDEATACISLKAAACVPLRVDDDVIGALWMGRDRDILPGELRLLGSLADMTGTALRRVGLHEETTRRLHRLSALRKIDLAITAHDHLNPILDVLLHEVIGQLHVDASAVLLIDEATGNAAYGGMKGFRNTNLADLRKVAGPAYSHKVIAGQGIVHRTDTSGPPAWGIHSLFAAEGFVDYYGVPLMVKGSIKGVLEVFHREIVSSDQEWIDFLEALGGQAAIAINDLQLFAGLQHSNKELTEAYDDTIEGWSRALDLRDRETEGHTQRVTDMTLLLARAVGIAGEDLEHIKRGALLHDIGKMGIPDRILHKPGPLTAEEMDIMRRHPGFAYDMLSPIAYLRPALDIPYCHHEKWDGTGYPRGLKGEAIPFAARIFAVVDVWDALRSDRPYRKGWEDQAVADYIKEQSGLHFDPRIAAVFLSLIEAYDPPQPQSDRRKVRSLHNVTG